MKLTISALVLFLSLLWLACAQATTPQPAEKNSQVALPSDPSVEDCIIWDFHYLITQDHQMTSSLRKLEVFMDAEAFSEVNLKRLFRYISDKNPDPRDESNNLIVAVKTDWKQLRFPSDCPPSGSSGGDSGKNENVQHWATFYRRGEKEFFTYNPEKKLGSRKDVIMKGSKIFRNGAWQTPF